MVLAVGVAAAAASGCRRGGDEAEGSGSDQAEAAQTPSPDTATPRPPIQTTPAAQIPDVEPEPAQPPAERELAVRLGLAPARPLVVSHLLTHPDVRELAGFTGELRVTSLEGIEPAPGYNTIRLASGDGFGFALQVWRLDTARQAEARFERLSETFIIATEDPTPVGEAAFASSFEGIRTYVFLHEPSRSVAALSCQSVLCNEGQARSLAERVASRL